VDSSAVGFASLGDARVLVRQVLRSWPIVVVVTLVAVASSIWALDSRKPSYSATARLLISPLPQWDQTFLGTSLIRDAGDARLTASTVAEVLKGPDSAIEAADSMGAGWTPRLVQRAVFVEAVPDTNVIAVTAHSGSPHVAAKLAEEFVNAVLRSRWRTIKAEVAKRASLAEKSGISIPSEGAVIAGATGAQVLNFVRLTGSDPTLAFQGATPPEQDNELKPGYVVVLAIAGGLFLGSLAALAMGRLSIKSPAVDRDSLPDGSDAPLSAS
jgi:uncharacterized protein involved in exopolysaccharide biosynthesis